MKISQKKLTTLLHNASKPSKDFEKKLRKEMLMFYKPTVYKQETSTMKKLIIASTGLIVIIAIASTMTLFKKDQNNNNLVLQTDTKTSKGLDKVTVESKNPQTGSGNAAGTSLPGDQNNSQPKLATIEDASKLLTFTPVVMKEALIGEGVSEIIVSDSFINPNEKILYTSYARGEKMLYQTIQSPTTEVQGEIPPEVKQVPVTFLGQTLNASMNQFWDESTPEADVYPGTPRVTLSWVHQGVAYDLSEYGDVSVEQLQSIVKTLIRY